jgi:ribosome-associated toxin RatA of RatAB toxin-antitoxin module
MRSERIRPGLPFALAPSLALSFALALLGPASTSVAQEWSLERQQDGIDVFTRPVAGSNIKAFKGEGLVDADIEIVLRVIRDSDHYQDWFPNCPESKLLERAGAVSYQYSVTAAPWPVDDRDNIFRSVLERDATTGRIEISITAAPEAYPIQPGRVRVQRANGSWQLEPAANGSTRVAFTMHLEPGGGVPSWMVNARILSTPFEAITNLRGVVAK